MAHFAVFIQRVGLFKSWNKVTDAEKEISRFIYHLVLFWVLSVFTTPRKGAAWRLGKDVSRYSGLFKQLSKQDGILYSKHVLWCLVWKVYFLFIRRNIPSSSEDGGITREPPPRRTRSRDPTKNTLRLLTRVSPISRYFFRYFQMLTTLDLFTGFTRVLLFSLILYGIIYFDSWF